MFNIMAEREIAQRLFAKEFNGSTLSLTSVLSDDSSDMNSPNLLISPTGMRINRVFVVGVITEVENLGSETGKERDLWRARVSDPTGVFMLYAGQYQPEAAIFLSTVEVPSYVAVVGKARIYEPEKDSVFISIRPEELNTVESTIRDRWVVDTAELTLKRLDLLSEVLLDPKHGEDMAEPLKSGIIGSGSSEAILDAIAFYGTDQDYIAEFKQSLRTILLSIKENAGTEMQRKDNTENVIFELLKELDSGKGVKYSHLLKEVESRGIPEEVADAGIRSLLDKGECYEPRLGLLKLI
jgi:hypothetical protein